MISTWDICEITDMMIEKVSAMLLDVKGLSAAENLGDFLINGRKSWNTKFIETKKIPSCKTPLNTECNS